MRILHVVESTDVGFGGLSKSVLDLESEMRRMGHEVHVVSRDGLSPRCTDSKAGLPEGLRRFGLSRELSEAIKYRAKNAEVIHVHGLWRMHNIYAAGAAAAAGIPFLVSTHGMLSPEALKISAYAKRAAWWAFQRRILNCAAAIHVTSAREELDVSAKGVGRRIVTIPLGFEFPPTEAGELPRSNNVLFLGRIHPIKNLELLIDAWAGLPESVAVDGWQLLIAGDGKREYVEQLQQRAHEHKNIKFLGPAVGPQKDQLLASASLLVLPSRSENFGLVVLEALAQGTPVVCSTGAPWEQIGEQGCGLWVTPDISNIRAALAWFIEQPASHRIAMGRRGKIWARENFCLERTVTEMTKLYSSVRTAMNT